MTHSIVIRQKGGLFKNTPDFAALKKQFSSAVYMGGIGRFFEFVDQPQPPGGELLAAYMLYGVGSPLGRGFYLYIDKNFSSFEVTAALPTTTNDLVDMFTFAEQLAKYLGARDVEDENGVHPRAALPALYPEVLKKNLEALKSYAISRPGFSVSGVRFPVQIPNLVCGRIAGVPPQNGEKFFSAYLDEKQRVGMDYLMPAFYRDEATGEAMGRYDLPEDTALLIPKSPFVPYGPDPFEGEVIAGWRAALVSTQLGMLGTLPYGVFLERLRDIEKLDFDDKLYKMRGLGLPRMQEILEGV